MGRASQSILQALKGLAELICILPTWSAFRTTKENGIIIESERDQV